MKKVAQESRKKSAADVEKSIQTLRLEIEKMKLELTVNKQKDTNLIMKKQKELAVLLTIKNTK